MTALTRGLNAVYKRLHLGITFGLVSVKVGTSADDTPSPVPELTVGLVLFLALISIWREPAVDVREAVDVTAQHLASLQLMIHLKSAF